MPGPGSAALAVPLRHRRLEIAAAARGRVLDLGGWADHLDRYDTPDVTVLDEWLEIDDLDAGEPFDTIVTITRTPLVTDVDGLFRRISELLTTDGNVLLLEPVDPRRDIPARVRRAGLSIIDLDRFDVRTMPRRERRFFAGRARHRRAAPTWPVP